MNAGYSPRDDCEFGKGNYRGGHRISLGRRYYGTAAPPLLGRWQHHGQGSEEIVAPASVPAPFREAAALARVWIDRIFDTTAKFDQPSIARLFAWQVWLETALEDWKAGSPIAAPQFNEEITAEVAPVLGELANIIVGNFKSNLCDAGLTCKLSPPQIAVT